LLLKADSRSGVFLLDAPPGGMKDGCRLVEFILVTNCQQGDCGWAWSFLC